MTLNDYTNTMRDKWWVETEEDQDRHMTTDQLMTGFEMLELIRNASAWDEDGLIKEAPYIMAKDLLLTLSKVLNIEWEDAETWDDVYNALESKINEIE